MSRAPGPGGVLMTMAVATRAGAGEAALHFAEALRRRGWRVAMVWGPAARPEDGAAAAAAMRTAGVEVHDLDRVIAPTPPVWRRLRTLARAFRPSAVVGIMQRDRAIAMALSRWLQVPGIVAAQNQHVFWGPLPVSLAKRLVYRSALRRWASLVVCTSEPVRREIIAFGVAADRTVVLPNGIRLTERVHLSGADRMAARAELGAGPDDVLILNVGRFDVQKGQDILVEAFALCARDHQHARLALIGDVATGPNRERMEAFASGVRRRAAASGAGDRICLAGWRADVPRLLGAADGYVHAARWEGFSFAVLEAFAASLPVVITDCSGRPEGFVDGRHGWVVPRGEVQPLATGIDRLIHLSSEARTTMGRAGRDLVEAHYDIRVIGPRFADLVAEAVARGR